MVTISIERKSSIDPRSILDTLTAKPPPRGLTPIGDSGFYRTPDGPISPFDCNNYPNSPYCGSFPLDRRAVAADASVDIHACGFDLQIDPTLGWVKMASARLSYRFPGECRKEPPPNPPPEDIEKFPKRANKTQSTGFDKDKGISESSTVYALIGIQVYSWSYLNNGCFGEPPQLLPTVGLVVNEGRLRCPYPGELHKDHNNFDSPTQIAASWTIYNSVPIEKKISCPLPNGGVNNNVLVIGGFKNDIIPRNEGWNVTDPLTDVYTVSLVNLRYRSRQSVKGGEIEYMATEKEAPPPYETYRKAYFVQGSAHLVYGRWGLIKKLYTSESPLSPEDEEAPGAGEFLSWDLLDIIEPTNCPDRFPYQRNPPLQEDNHRHCCMQCCSPASSSNNSNNQDLKEVLTILRRLDKNVGVFPTKVSIFDIDETKEEAQPQVLDIASISQGIVRIVERVEKISKIVGVDTFPLELPETLIEKVDQNIIEMAWDWITPDKTIKINNVMGLLVYILKYQNAVFGQWMQKIHIKDEDAVKEGDQSKDIVIPDMANALREILTLVMGIYKALGLCTDISLKNLTESATIKQEIVKALLTIKDIQQWLDYTTDERHLKVPIQITVGEIKNIEITGNESEE